MTLVRIRFRWAAVLTAIACAIGSCVAATALVGAATPDEPGDVRAWVETYEKVWNTHQASAVAAFFAEDADFIAGNGPRLVGRDAIQEWWRSYFSGIDEARKGTFAIKSLRIISADVILLNIDSTTAGRGPSGQALPTRLARGTWVATRHDGTWQIVAFRALPAEGDVRSSPGTDR